MFHFHDWVDEAKTFTGPNLLLREVSVADAESFNRTVHGFTNITQRCTKCGKINVITVSGEV